MYLSTATTMIPLLPALVQIGAGDGSGITETTILVTAQIRRAEGVVNGKIARRYDMSGYTITTAPPLAKTLCEDISSYYIMRAEFSGDNVNMNEWTEKFEESMKLLDEIFSGDMDLANTAGAIIDERDEGVVESIASNNSTYTPTFGQDTATAWEVDPEKIQSIDRS